MAKKRQRPARRRQPRSGPAARRKTAQPVARRRDAGRARSAKKAARPARKTAPKAAAKLIVRPRGAARPPAAKPADARSAKARPPALDRKRRTLDETVQTPPSSLDFDRHPSAARTGHAELNEKLREHTESSPALTGGDVDADWEEAYSSGDEAPGGDNMTPDENVVEDIGRSLGVEYEDNEELRSSDKIADRDAKRWELDPASSEDYRDRSKK